MVQRPILVVLALLVLPGVLHAGHVDYQGSITEDSEQFSIRFPNSVQVDPASGEIYITSDTGVHVYTNDWFPLYTLDQNYIRGPNSTILDAEGNLYVGQPAKPKHKISVFNAAFMWERDIYLEGFEGAEKFVPYRLDIDKEGNLYVAGSQYPSVLVIDREGRLLDMLSPEEGGNKVNVMVNDVAVDDNGRIYLVSEDAGHIYVFNEDREFLFRFGEKGGSTGKLSRPRGVAPDAQRGVIYVVDYMRHGVSAYDYANGDYLFEFGGRGWGEGWFQHPSDIAVDSVGNIFVCDRFNNRVEVFRPEDLELGETGSGGTEVSDGG